VTGVSRSSNTTEYPKPTIPASAGLIPEFD